MPVCSTSLQAPREASLSRTVNSSPARTWGGIEAQRRRSVRRAPANTVRDLRPLVRREVSTTDGSCATRLIFDNSGSNVHYPLARVRTSSNVPRPPLIELAHQACVRARASERAVQCRGGPLSIDSQLSMIAVRIPGTTVGPESTHAHDTRDKSTAYRNAIIAMGDPGQLSHIPKAQTPPPAARRAA